jgi:hypothetical protein
MPTLQEALSAALSAPKPVPEPAAPAPTPKIRPQPARRKVPGLRRVAVGTWDDAASRLPVNFGGTFNRTTLSKPPQEHEANFAERYFTKEPT